MGNENRDFLDEHFAAEQVAPKPEQVTGEVTEQVQEVQQQGTVEEKPPETVAAEVTTTPESKEGQTVPYAAMKAEREKRQRLERELEELRQTQQTPPEAQPSYFDDPEGYLQRQAQAIRQESSQKLYAALEASAREQHPDYDEVFEVVMKHAQANPAVSQEILSAPNPAMAAYRMGKKLAEFEKMQDPDAYRAQIEAELRVKWDEEQKSKSERRQQAVAEIPPDLSQARNTRGEFAANPDVFNQLFNG